MNYQIARDNAYANYIESNRKQAGFDEWWKNQPIYQEFAGTAEKITSGDSSGIDLDLSHLGG